MHGTADREAPRPYGDSEFRLGPEDVLDVSVYQEKELSTTVPVRGATHPLDRSPPSGGRGKENVYRIPDGETRSDPTAFAPRRI